MLLAYDIESYPNFFCCTFRNATRTLQFICPQRLRKFLSFLSRKGATLVGFNNLAYDSPMLHYIIANPACTVADLWSYTQEIIGSEWPPRFQEYIKQIDLLLLWHFDNNAKRTSLKDLEFAMRMSDIQDLPYAPGTYLTLEQRLHVLEYNDHDVKATWEFYLKSLKQIEFRASMGYAWMNFNDGKIGKEYFIQRMGRTGRTQRDSIALGDVILPYVKFRHPEFQRILDFFKSTTITQTKGVFKDLSATINGFKYDFGAGGIHGSKVGAFHSIPGDYIIYDWDVASYYPNLAIANRLYPDHLGEDFCDIYEDVFNQRKVIPKSDPRNGMLKLALNSVYGDSNNQYSKAFYDPKYTMAITINGQLLLCMLAEWLNLEMIQINTDGLTVKCPVDQVEHMHAVIAEWESVTGLTMESAVYKSMWIKDVNNYIALGDKPKRKGAYAFDRAWHQNHSMLIVPKAVSKYLLEGIHVEESLLSCRDIYDFCIRAKVARTHKLFYGGSPVQRITRYYASVDGKPLVKMIPSKGTIGHFKRARGVTGDYDDTVWQEGVHTKNKSTWKDTYHSVCKSATVCNKIVDFPKDLDYDYYLNECKKLLEAFE